MQLVPVQSSNLAAVGYEPMTYLLEIQFRNGTAYQYFNVPSAVHQGLMEAQSKGQYFDHFVKKPGYAFKQVR
ncbi:KTSC domain-containing protein [Kitasatospora sp. NPDC049285]|uniref:KTSC domain-containing protein n=1 Tax=Kitasatospora sp. NPDC049285 TaxID=3157096 RepID=UPI003441CB21